MVKVTSRSYECAFPLVVIHYFFPYYCFLYISLVLIAPWWNYQRDLMTAKRSGVCPIGHGAWAGVAPGWVRSRATGRPISVRVSHLAHLDTYLHRCQPPHAPSPAPSIAGRHSTARFMFTPIAQWLRRSGLSARREENEAKWGIRREEAAFRIGSVGSTGTLRAIQAIIGVRGGNQVHFFLFCTLRSSLMKR